MDAEAVTARIASPSTVQSEAQLNLSSFWPRVTEEIRKVPVSGITSSVYFQMVQFTSYDFNAILIVNMLFTCSWISKIKHYHLQE